MSRTKLMDRQLPNYTVAEERMNMISHIVGGGISAIGLILLVNLSLQHGSGRSLICSVIFGLSMILLYTMSSIYHGLPDGRGKRVLQVLDHCTIYVLIAGSYTPVLLCAIAREDPRGAALMLLVIWILAALAIVLNAIDLRQFRVISMVLYLGMGWTIILELPALIHTVGQAGFLLILSGGLCYTVGSVLYGLGKQHRYMHSIFHLFVVAGTVCHILAILFYVI